MNASQIERDSRALKPKKLPQFLAILLVIVLPMVLTQTTNAQDQSGEAYGEDYGNQSGDAYDEEMQDSLGDSYGGDSYGGGSSQRGRTAASGPGSSPRQAAAGMLQGQFASLMGDLAPLMSNSAQFAGVSTGPVLGGDAENAYRGGNYELALQLYYAHMVTEFDEARVNLQTVKYSSLLRRPVWQIRWGVSYAVHGDVSADPSPIFAGKTPQGSPRNGRGNSRGGGQNQGDDLNEYDEEAGRGGQGGRGGGGRGGQQGREEEMEEYEDEMSMEFGGGGGESDVSMSLALAPKRSMLDPTANATLEKYLGLVSQTVAQEFSTRYQQGDFGNAMCTLAAPVADLEDEAGGPPARGESRQPQGRPRGAIDDLLDSSPEGATLWIPGVSFLGEGDSKSTIQSAKGVGIELLLHFDVALKVDRNEKVKNTARCRLFNVATGKSLASSKGMDSLEIEQLAQVGRSNETTYVKDGLASIFLVMDRQVKAIDMPKLSPEVAKRRVATLLSATGPRRLRALAEIRLYQAQGLLKPEEVELAFHIMGGQEGLSIMHGPNEEKLKTAREWAVRALPRASDDS